MSDDGSVTRWFDQARSGDEEAIEALWRRYYARLVEYAQSRLPSRRRQVQDEEDLALSAFATFIRRAQQGSFPSLRDRDGLWRLLLTITARKAANVVQHELRQKRRGGRTVHVGVDADEDSSCQPPPLETLIGREPTAEFALEVAEQYEHLMNRLEDQKARTIAQMKFEGFENAEIARKLRVSKRTVERKLELIRQKWAPT